MFKVKGKVTEILTPITGQSTKGEWSKFDAVVNVPDGEYPKSICFTIFNKPELYEKLQINQEVEVSFSIDVREYQGKFFNNVSAFKVDIQSHIPFDKREEQRKEAQAKVSQTRPSVSEEEKDDLPF
jgi:hypothetical protein